MIMRIKKSILIYFSVIYFGCKGTCHQLKRGGLQNGRGGKSSLTTTKRGGDGTGFSHAEGG